VEFEGGDLTYPIWTGCFWADGEISPATDAAPEVKFWKMDAVFVRIDGAAGEIVFETQGGAKLTISATEIKAQASTVAQGVGPPLSGITLASWRWAFSGHASSSPAFRAQSRRSSTATHLAPQSLCLRFLGRRDQIGQAAGFPIAEVGIIG
jgi:hypothetical protein